MKHFLPRMVFHIRPWVWRYGLLLVALAILIFVFVHLGLASRVDEPTDLDIAVHSWVIEHRDRWPAVTSLARKVTQLGNPVPATTAAVLVAGVLLALHVMGVPRVSKVEPFFWLAVIATGAELSRSLKLVFQRDRPPLPFRLVVEQSHSFPSGHSVFAANFFLMLGILLARMMPTTRPWLRIACVAVCALLALALALSRIWLGVHYPTDVGGGLLLGVTWVLVAWMIRIGWRHWRHLSGRVHRRVGDG